MTADQVRREVAEPTMTTEAAAALRAPFLPTQIGKLPKPYSKDAPKQNCPECGKRHGMPAAHVDYAGHAAVTDRLLQVDPAWAWEPAAIDPQTGGPLIANGGLWIRLTVCGVTRLGFGDSDKHSVKEMIGDAIRNAAMRFGVGLDLWAKESLTEGEHDPPGGPDRFAAERHDLRTKIADLATEQNWDVSVLGQEFTATYGASTANASPADLAAYLRDLQQRASVARLDHTEAPAQEPEGSAFTAAVEAETPAKTADQWRDEVLAANTKAEVVRLMRDIGLAKMSDAEVGDENSEATTLDTLANRRLKEVGKA